MSKIRSRGNVATEQVVAKLFRQHGITGWRRHQKLKGTPDFTFYKEKTVVFVDGCYWHGCPRCSRVPKSNVEFWINKFESNKRRDRRVNRELRASGWHVIRVWQCRLKSQAGFLSRLRRTLKLPAE
ncbi:very short patch repair endonuclease [Rhodoferax sp. WC2427]|uniref:very short patch repair endonuclease n=1 Tax=Rhodoferax sp. WC2427 TaxID=3234144 RepID=UPI003465C7ED